MKRHLLSATRTVTDRGLYLTRWLLLRDAVHERGGQAWMFVSADDPSRYIEFIEWKQAEQASPLIADDVVRVLRADLEPCGSATEQHWKELESE